MMVELVAKFYYRISGIIFICIISDFSFWKYRFIALIVSEKNREKFQMNKK